jgi:hypothetical protein
MGKNDRDFLSDWTLAEPGLDKFLLVYRRMSLGDEEQYVPPKQGLTEVVLAKDNFDAEPLYKWSFEKKR